MPLEFEWDPAKAAANFSKHRVSFNEAATVFADPLASVIVDRAHSLEEERLVLFGMSERGRILAVMFAERGLRLRLISAREATRLERDAYEAGTL